MSFEEWQTVNLENALEILIDYRGKTPTKVARGIPLITAKIVKNGFIQEPDEFIAEEDYETWMVRGFPKIGDVVLTTEAPLGEVAQINDENVALAQRIITLRGKKGILDNTFLKYFLISKTGQTRLKERETGTTVTGIKQSELRLIKIDLPPLSTQCRIAGILSALDDKIELNRQTNATLEAIAQSIFKEWFVENEKAYEWDLAPLPEVIEINPPRSLKVNQITPYLDMANMPTTGHRVNGWVNRPFGSGTKFITGDTLIAKITPCLENGKTAYVDFLDNGQIGWGSTEYIIFRPKPPIPPEYGYFLARSDEIRNYAIQNMIGTSGRQRVPVTCFNFLSIRIPPTDLAIQFGIIAESLMKQIKANSEESKTLSFIRDALMPKLMSGEIQVINDEI